MRDGGCAVNAPVTRSYAFGGIAAQLQAYSKSRLTGIEIFTWLLRYPRFIHAELGTHRMTCRSSASSRAIPIQRIIDAVLANPAETVFWGKNQAGMQSFESCENAAELSDWWKKAAQLAATCASEGARLGAHKQFVNRVLEPFSWMETLLTATDVNNFFSLRVHESAEPNFQVLAALMLKTIQDSVPVALDRGEWHTPFPEDDARELKNDDLLANAGRAARLSYLTHDGRKSREEDIALAQRLIESQHRSPFEHIATPVASWSHFGPLRGWRSYRRLLPAEAGPSDPLWYKSDEATARVRAVFERFAVTPHELPVKGRPGPAQE